MEVVRKARAFAKKHHGDKVYAGVAPFVESHLDVVAAICRPYGEDAMVVAYLHDVVEETNLTIQDIEEEFGPVVARWVWVVTDPDLPNRRMKKEASNKKFQEAGYEDNVALIVKAADRLANMSFGYWKGDSFFQMYLKELADFRSAAYRDGLCDEIWRGIYDLRP